MTREAYSHEVSSAGFWPGGGGVPHAAFYSYAYPEPPGFAASPVAPGGAFYDADPGRVHPALRRRAPLRDPEATLLDVLQSTYEAAADLAGWDREALEREVDVAK